MAETAGNYARIQALQQTGVEPCASSGKRLKSTTETYVIGQTMTGCRGTGSDRVGHRVCTHKIILYKALTSLPNSVQFNPEQHKRFTLTPIGDSFAMRAHRAILG